MIPNRCPFSELRPGQTFRFKDQWFARSHDWSDYTGYRMHHDYSGYTKAVGFLPSTLIYPGIAIESGLLPTPITLRYLGRNHAA